MVIYVRQSNSPILGLCILFFLSHLKELEYKDSVLSLDLTVALFGTCLSLCLNSVLLWYTPTEEIMWLQYVTITLNLATLTKAFAGAIGFDVVQLRLQRSLL